MITRSGFIKTALLAVAVVLTGRRATREVFEIGSNRLCWVKGRGQRRVFFVNDLHIGHADIDRLECMAQTMLTRKHACMPCRLVVTQ